MIDLNRSACLVHGLLPLPTRTRVYPSSGIIRPVEAIFGSFKRLYGRARVRYREFRRNLADFYRLATIYNLRRAVTLTAA